MRLWKECNQQSQQFDEPLCISRKTAESMRGKQLGPMNPINVKSRKPCVVEFAARIVLENFQSGRQP